MKQYADWVYDFQNISDVGRRKLKEELLTKFKEKPMMKSFLENSSENVFQGFTHGVMFIPKEKNTLLEQQFSMPGLMYKYKKGPLLIVVSAEGDWGKFKKPHNLRTKDLLSWVHTVLRSTQDEKKKIKKQLLEGIKRYEPNRRYREGEKVEPTELGVKLTSFLESQEFIGFVPVIDYFMLKGFSEAESKALWTHPTGGAYLLYKHKSMPILFLAAPSMRLNHSHVVEVSDNKFSDPIRGLTD